MKLRWVALVGLSLAAAAAAALWRQENSSAAADVSGAVATGAAAPRAALAVSVTTPTVLIWPTPLMASGSIAAWQEAVISAQIGSLRIAELHVDVGQSVKRGQLLARLADDTLKAALAKQNASVATARANLEQAHANVMRARSVSGSGALSAKSVDDYGIAETTGRAALASAEADQSSARIQLEQTRIVAVDDGYVSSRSALLGNVVAAGTELYRLVRQGRVEWRAEVDAQRLGQVGPGQIARVGLPDGSVTEGRVRLVAPTLSTSTNRAIVYVSLRLEHGVAPGMFASGTIEGSPSRATTLPQSAVVARDGRSDIYLLLSNGTVSRRTVVTGRRRGDRIEVMSELPEGAKVVASGGAFLADGVKVQLVDQLAASDADRSVR